MEKTTSKNNDSSKKLSILISRDGLSFCISEKTQEKIDFYFKEKFEQQIAPEKILERLKRILENQLANKLEEVFEIAVLYCNTLYSFVPDAYFDEKNLTDYLKYNIKILPTDFATYDAISSAPIKNVYLPYININNFLFENFGEFTYRHTSSVLAEKTLLKNTTSDAEMHVHVQGIQLDICVVKNAELLFCNSFEYETANDLVYYVLFSLEQLRLSPEETPVTLSGEIEKHDEVYTLLYTYIRTIEFEKLPASVWKLPENLKKEAYYKNHILLSSLTCA